MTHLPIQQIKSAANILTVISEHVQLRKSGPGYTGRCPFHDERTPSFRVNPEGQFFKCFGCGAAGDVFKFVQLIESIPFREAAQRLAERFGVPLAAETATVPAVPVDAAAERRKRIYAGQIDREATWWQRRTLRALHERAETVAGLACAWWGLTGEAGHWERRAGCWRRAVLNFRAMDKGQIVAMYTRRRLRMAPEWKLEREFLRWWMGMGER